MAKQRVKVECFKDCLRLRWSCDGHRYCLSPGLADTPTNRAIAQLKAAEIDRDIAYGRFDPTLARYKPDALPSERVKAWELFERFTGSKKGKCFDQTLSKYRGLVGRLKEFFRDKQAGSIGGKEAIAFRDWLSELIAPITLKERITMLSACWNWAIKQKLIAHNPWVEAAEHLPRIAKRPPDPFSEVEIRGIVRAFRNSPYYAYYGDYVEFLLGSGCRIGEAIALTWGDFSDDCDRMWIGKSYYRGQLKETKNSKAGWVPLSRNLQRLLMRRRSPDVQAGDLVFPAVRGGYINDRDFRNRAWKKTLEALGIPYRKPYTTRSTLISFWLSQGEDPLTVAKYTRTSVKMIYEHYAWCIQTNSRLPELAGLSDLFDGAGD